MLCLNDNIIKVCEIISIAEKIIKLLVVVVSSLKIKRTMYRIFLRKFFSSRD